MDGYRGICQIHGEYHDVVLCPVCTQEMFHSMAFTTMSSATAARLDQINLNLTQPSEIEPISLGRWEEQTDTDREFLQACGISQE